MNYFAIFLKCLPYIGALVKAAETFYTSPKSGADKKAAVTEALQTIVVGMTDVSTGGQKETWVKISPLISMAIDLFAGLAFPSHKPASPDAG